MSRLDSVDSEYLTCVDTITILKGIDLVSFEDCNKSPDCEGCPAHIDEYSDRLKKLLTLQGGEPDE